MRARRLTWVENTSASHSHKKVRPSRGSLIEQHVTFGVPSGRAEETVAIIVERTPQAQDTVVGNIFKNGDSQAIETPPRVSSPHLLPFAHSQSHTVIPWMTDSPLPSIPIRDTVISERDAQLVGDLHRASAMAIPQSAVSRQATALKELSVVTSRGPSFADLGVKYTLQLSRAGGVHDLIGRILGQQHTGQQNREKNQKRPQTEEQRGKRACALTAR